MSAQIFPAVKGLQLVVEPPIDSATGQVRDDLSGIKVWYSTQNNIDTTTAPQLKSDSLNIFIPDLLSGTLYYVKYALVSYLDEAQFNDSELLQAIPLSGAVAVDLSIGTQVFTYTAQGENPSPANTTITATARNTSGTVYYEFILAGTTVQNTNANIYTYTPQANQSNMPQQIVVKVREQTNNSTVLAQDTITLIGVKPGVNGIDAVSGFLTNESATVSTLSDGTGGVYTSAGGTFKVYSGITDVTASATYSVVTANTTGGLSISINTAGVYTVTGLTDDSGTATLRAVYGTVTIEKIYSISKSKQGIGGTPGVPGTNTAQVVLYAKNTSSTAAPDSFSGTFTYTFSTGQLTGGTLNGWSTTPPSIGNGEYLWARYAVAASNTATDTVLDSDFGGAVVDSIGGINGDPGTNTAQVVLYAKNTSSTAAPDSFTGTFTYYFSTGQLIGGTFNSWSTTPPSIAKGDYLWARYAVAASNTATDTLLDSDFGGAVVDSIGGIDGTPGVPGTNTAQVVLYAKNTDPINAPASFSGTFTYTFSTGQLTGGTLNGWSTAPPSIGNGEYLWARYAVAASNTATDTVLDSDFGGAVVDSIGGINGDPGTNTAQVVLYAKNTSSTAAPDSFTGPFTYNFSTGQLTGGTLNGWSTTPPSIAKGDYLWARYAVAASNTATDTLLDSDFGGAVVDSIGGIDGNSAKAVDLTVSTQVFTYSEQGTNPSPINSLITASARNTTGTVYYEFILAGTTVQNNAENTYTYIAKASHSNMPEQITVNIRQGTNDSTILASDVITLIGVKPGVNGIDAVSGFLTNESATVSTLSDGTGGVYTSAGGTFKVYSGITDVTASATYSVVTGNTTGGLSISINTAGVYTVTGLTDNSGTATLRAVYDTVTIEKIYSISKSKQGAKGDSGEAAYSVTLGTSAQAITYDQDGSNPTPSPIIISGAIKRLGQFIASDSDPDWDYTYDFQVDINNQSGSSDVYVYSPPSTFTNSSILVSLNVYKVPKGQSSPSYIVGSDQISLVSIKPGDKGDNGTRTAILELYRWGTSVPTTFPIGNTVYTWATGSFTTNQLTLNGWSTIDSVGSGTANQTLYVTRQIYTDTTTDATSSIGWTATTVAGVGLNGSNGTSGTWTKYVYAYKLANRANSSTASVPPARPEGGVFNINTFELAAPDGWLNFQPPTVGGTVYVSRNRVGPSQATTGTIDISGTWSTPLPASQILENGASYTYDVESISSTYVPAIVTTTVYTKAASTGLTPTTPSGGTFLFDNSYGNTTTAPTGWYNTIALVDASTLPAQNPVFQSSTTITTVSDILSYTPTWSSPQYQFRTGGQISANVIQRDQVIGRSFTIARVWTEVLGSGPQPNSANRTAFNLTSDILVALAPARINYSVNGAAFQNITTNVPNVNWRGIAASTDFMVLSNNTGSSTIYVNTLSSGLPSTTWTTVSLGTAIGSSIMSIYSIIKLNVGWLAVGDISGTGAIIFCNSDDPRTAGSWSRVTSIPWGGTGTLPGLRSVAQTVVGGNSITVAVGVNGTVIQSLNAVPNTGAAWTYSYGPGVGEIFTGSSSVTINTVAANPSSTYFGVFSIGFDANGLTTPQTYLIKYNTGGLPTVYAHPTITMPVGYITPTKILKLIYSYSLDLLFAITNLGLFVSNVTLKGSDSTPSIGTDNWRMISTSDPWGDVTSSNIAISYRGYLLAIFVAPFNYTDNKYYYLGTPTSAELQASFLRTSPQVGDVVSIQLNSNSSQGATDKNFTIGLRCTGVGSTGAASEATWSRVAAWIDGDMVVSGSITADSLAVNSIIAEKIQAGSITAEKLSANTVLVNQSLTVGNPVVSGTTISSGSGAVITGGSTTSTNTVAFGNSSGSIVVKDGTINLNGKIVPPKNANFGVVKDALVMPTYSKELLFPEYSGTVYSVPGKTFKDLLTSDSLYPVTSILTITTPSSDSSKQFKISIDINIPLRFYRNYENRFAGIIGLVLYRTNISDGFVPPTEATGIIPPSYYSPESGTVTVAYTTVQNQIDDWGTWPRGFRTNISLSTIESTSDTATTVYSPIVPGKTYRYTAFLYLYNENSNANAYGPLTTASYLSGSDTIITAPSGATTNVNDIYGSIISTPYNTELPNTYFSLTTTVPVAGSNVLYFSSTAGILRGMTVMGTGIPPKTAVYAVYPGYIELVTFNGVYGADSAYLTRVWAVEPTKIYFGPPLIRNITSTTWTVWGSFNLSVGTLVTIWRGPMISTLYGGIEASNGNIKVIGYYTQDVA